MTGYADAMRLMELYLGIQYDDLKCFTYNSFLNTAQ